MNSIKQAIAINSTKTVAPRSAVKVPSYVGNFMQAETSTLKAMSVQPEAVQAMCAADEAMMLDYLSHILTDVGAEGMLEGVRSASEILRRKF